MISTTTSYHLVRVGILGRVGRFVAADAACHPRLARVVCRTPRGLEVGEVLSHVAASARGYSPDGTIVRALTAEDELWQTRLGKNRRQAYQACVQRLRQHGSTATLVDVEQLFDGRTLYFYFLGEVPQEIQPLVAQLAEDYEAQVRLRDFVAAVEQGCGPDCGTDQAAGCGAACDTCPAASACRTRPTASG